jgi:hypothetical protein
MAAAVMTCGAARADDLTESSCYVMAEGADGSVQRVLEDVHVLGPMKKAPAFMLYLPDSAKHASVVCDRSDIIPDLNDWKVLKGGYPLFIRVQYAGGTMMVLTLEVVDGRIQAGFKQDAMPPEDQQKALQARIDELQSAFDGKAPG